MTSDLPPEFQQIFGNLKRPVKALTPAEEAGKALTELARKFPKSDNQK